MNRASLILSAAALDALLGDPETWPHPVRLFGFLIARGEWALNRPRHSAAFELTAGALLSGGLVCATYSVTDVVLTHLGRVNPRLKTFAEVLLGASCLAARSLDDEATAVIRALERGDLVQARTRLSRIVGRDTAALDEAGISRAVIETLAESASDGIVAPLFYLVAGGVPLAMAFKAASTLDSMIGHREERYLYFGRCAARLDDAANLIPSRLTAALFVLLSGQDSSRALKIWLRDGSRHASPNAGQPEAAMAGALGVRLGGANSYGGEWSESPHLGAEYPQPTVAHARRARTLVRRAALAAALGACALALLSARRRQS